MQNIPDELVRALSQRLKLGDHAKPVCRIEVDRLVYLPGKTEKIQIEAPIEKTVRTYKQTFLDASGTTSGETVAASDGIVIPASGPVTSPFGDGRSHMGIDYGCPMRSDVKAAWSGTVVGVYTRDPYRSWGYYVEVKHGNGLMTRYAHLSSILVREGQEVAAGQVIAKSGNTGNVADYRGTVSGTYDDPDSPRSKGWGAHLHFEILVNGNRVDPTPYLSGAKKIFTTAQNTGTGVQDGASFTGVPGKDALWEYFTDRDWHANKAYQVDDRLKKHGSVQLGLFSSTPSNGLLLQLDPKTTPKDAPFGFTLNLPMQRAGLLHIGYRSDFADDGELRVYINDRLQAKVTRFEGWGAECQLRNLVFSGSPSPSKIRIEVRWKGNKANRFALHFVRVQELELRDEPGVETTAEPVILSADPVQRKLQDLLFNGDPKTAEFQFGQFSYVDTLVLDNVRSIEIDDQFDMLSREARIQISNPNGRYSPDYNPYYFPETFQETPWSYMVNGYQIGVLSTNAPIRIYLGYGMNPVRVFTGLIDKVDMVGEEHTMTIFARDMYKKLMNKTITEEKEYPDNIGHGSTTKTRWLKSAIVQDLIEHAGMYAWRAHEQDLYYPDAVVDETYLIEQDPYKNKVIKAVPDQEGVFMEQDPGAILTPDGWRNPFVQEYARFRPYELTVSEAIDSILQDTHLRSYCDRYGTYRLEPLDLERPIAAHFDQGSNLVTITKSLDWSKAYNHVVVVDELGYTSTYQDTFLKMQLKGELRTFRMPVGWAKSEAAKAQVAKKVFFDFKRLCQTLQVSVPGNPALDVLDRVYVSDSATTTRDVYTIKGIRTLFSLENGYMQILDLMWSNREGAFR